MANRERAFSLSGRGIGLDLYALSLGYFSLCEQRKVTRAPQAIGSLDCDSSLLFERQGESMKRPWMVPPCGGPEAARLRGNDGEVQNRRESARTLQAWI